MSLSTQLPQISISRARQNAITTVTLPLAAIISTISWALWSNLSEIHATNMKQTITLIQLEGEDKFLKESISRQLTAQERILLQQTKMLKTIEGQRSGLTVVNWRLDQFSKDLEK